MFAKFKQLEQLDMTDEFTVDEDDVLDELDESILPGWESSIPIPDSVYFAVTESIAMGMAERHPLNEERLEVARKFFNVCPTLKKVYLTRCESGQLFERERIRERWGEVKMTRLSGGKGPLNYNGTFEHHKFPFFFPRVLDPLEVIATNFPSPWDD